MRIGDQFYILEVEATYNGTQYFFEMNTVIAEGHLLVISFENFINQSVFVSSMGEFENVQLNFREGTIDPSTENLLYTEPTTDEESEELSSLEKMISKLLNGIANAINKLVAGVLGRAVTIDDLVFNDYPDTKLEYFHKLGLQPANSSPLIWGTNGDGVGGLYTTVNEWYGYFTCK